MLKKRIVIFAVALVAIINVYAQNVTGNARYVDPFIGVEGGGNVFPGPCVPIWNGKIRA